MLSRAALGKNIDQQKRLISRNLDARSVDARSNVSWNLHQVGIARSEKSYFGHGGVVLSNFGHGAFEHHCFGHIVVDGHMFGNIVRRSF